MRALYTTEATAHGGRSGHVRSSDGILDLDLRVPEQMGGRGGATKSGTTVRRRLRGVLRAHAARGGANAQAAADRRPNHGPGHAEHH
jgi:hypothetical protein